MKSVRRKARRAPDPYEGSKVGLGMAAGMAVSSYGGRDAGQDLKHAGAGIKKMGGAVIHGIKHNFGKIVKPAVGVAEHTI
jgi:hypothetical protein